MNLRPGTVALVFTDLVGHGVFMLPPGPKPGTKERPHVERRLILPANFNIRCICANRF